MLGALAANRSQLGPGECNRAGPPLARPGRSWNPRQSELRRKCTARVDGIVSARNGPLRAPSRFPRSRFGSRGEPQIWGKSRATQPVRWGYLLDTKFIHETSKSRYDCIRPGPSPLQQRRKRPSSLAAGRPLLASPNLPHEARVSVALGQDPCHARREDGPATLLPTWALVPCLGRPGPGTRTIKR